MTKRSDMMYGALSQVEGYWDALCRDTTLPTRSEIDPRGLEDVLEYAFVLERIAPGLARFRLAGMHLNDLMGMEVRGMPVSAMFLPEARRQLSEVLENIFKQPRITTLTLKGDGGIGRPKIEAQMIFLPLLDDFGDVTRILGCLQSKGRIGRQPRRFSITQAQSRFVGPVSHDQTTSQPVASFAEPCAGFTAAPVAKAPDAKRPALRLVKTDT